MRGDLSSMKGRELHFHLAGAKRVIQGHLYRKSGGQFVLIFFVLPGFTSAEDFIVGFAAGQAVFLCSEF